MIAEKTAQIYCRGKTAQEYFKEYREKNKERLRKQKKEYYERNKERINEERREYYRQNREKVLKRNKEYRQRPEVKEKIRERKREYQKEYKQRPEVKRRARAQAKKYYQRYRQKILMHNLQLKAKFVAQKGGKCEICGYSKCLPALEFHHVLPLSGRKRTQYELPQSPNFDLSKVMLVCSNCHIEIHYANQNKETVSGAFFGQKA